jgi:hypothetical protein
VFLLTVYVFLLFTQVANAGSTMLSFTAPTLNEDGTDYDDPGGYIVYWGTAVDNYPNSGMINDPAVTTYLVEDLTTGNWFFVVTAFDDKVPYNESEFSNVAMKLISDITPEPPTNLTVANTTVFTVVQQKDKFILLVVGTVPPDTVCDPNQRTNGHYAVPVAAVTFTGTVRPVVVVAQCQ